MLSNRAKYATRAILYLSLKEDQGPISIQEIASVQNIPLKFLQQILISLKVDGFVKSRKGPGGGYTLARSSSSIMLGSIIRSVDGPLAPISCVSVTQHAECGCPVPESCSLREAFQKVRDGITAVLDHTSFAELAQRQRDGLELPPIIS